MQCWHRGAGMGSSVFVIILMPGRRDDMAAVKPAENREEYEKLYKRSLEDPEGFWGEIADGCVTGRAPFQQHSMHDSKPAPGGDVLLYDPSRRFYWKRRWTGPICESNFAKVTNTWDCRDDLPLALCSTQGSHGWAVCASHFIFHCTLVFPAPFHLLIDTDRPWMHFFRPLAFHSGRCESLA